MKKQVFASQGEINSHVSKINDLRQIYAKTDIAESKAEYVEKMSVDIVGHARYSCFQGTLDNMFSGSKGQEESHYNIATVALRAEYYCLTLDFRKAKLDEEFQNNLLTMDVFEFYDMYGAYFISGVNVGGTVSATFIVDQTATFNQVEIESGATFALKDALAKGEIMGSFSREIKNSEYKCSMGMVVHGGNPNLLNDVDAWSKSAFENPCVIDWKLEPMHELLDDKQYPDKKSALLRALKPFLDRSSIATPTHLRIKIFNYDADCTVINGWKLLSWGASTNLFSQNLTWSAQVLM